MKILGIDVFFGIEYMYNELFCIYFKIENCYVFVGFGCYVLCDV